MDAAVRHLRVTRSGGVDSATFLLIQDDLQTVGQQVVYREVLSRLAKSLNRSGADARILVLAFGQPPSKVQHLNQPKHLHVVDLFSDPFGWLSLASKSQAEPVAWRAEKGLNRIQRTVDSHLNVQSYARDSNQPSWCVFIDSVDSMLQHAGLQQVLSLLAEVRRQPNVASVCATLHQDVHKPPVVAALTSVCSATLLLQPIQGLQKELAAVNRGKLGPPHGQLHLHLKRHTGRVAVEAELFSLQAQGGLDTFPPPQEAITAQLLAAHAVNKLESEQHAAQGAKERQAQAEEEARLALLTSQAGMKLTLTDKEQAARQSVVLPYEHQGAGQAYQTGDFKDYLPKAAGGQGKGTGEGALGHILYVRDSGSEHDSDEDPDDDLDI